MNSMKTFIVTAVLVLASATGLAGALDPPEWRDTGGSTLAEWRFDTDANPADPEVVTNAYGAPSANIAIGDFGEGWFDSQSNVFGSKQGFWDLGSAGTITIGVPNSPPCVFKEVWVQVTYWEDISAAPTVAVAGGTPLGDPVSPVLVEAGPAGGGWYCALTKWRFAPGPDSETVTITATPEWGALIENVVIDTLAGPDEVWVDDDWASLPDGTDVGAGRIIGFDAFDTIEEGVVAACTIVHVAVGDYAPVSTVVINKSLSILGPQANIDPRTTAPFRVSGISPEAIVDGGGVLATIFQIEADGVEINGFEILNATGDMIQSPSGGAGLSGVAIRRNIIRHATGGAGIRLQNVSDSVVEFNHVYDIAQDGINISSGSANCTIRSNEVDGNSSANAAIYVHSSTNTTIERNAVYDVSGDDGIKLGSTSGSDAALAGGSILRNIVHNIEQAGISIYMSDTVLDGNFVYNSTSENGAVYIGASVDNITLTKNSIHDNGVPADGRTTWGIRAGKDSAYPTNVVAHYNAIENNEGGLIYNYSSGAPSLDAEHNWWGSTNGPDDPVGTLELPDNPGATVAQMLNAAPAGLLGDDVSENVDYYPWTDTACVLDADVNCDCTVNVLDLLFVRVNLGDDPLSDPDAAKADVNGDGVVNILDMIYTRNRLRDRCPL